MTSKQFDHLQEASVARLEALIPPGCPLLVKRGPMSGFCVFTFDERDRMIARFEVVAAFSTCAAARAHGRSRNTVSVEELTRLIELVQQDAAEDRR
jgi:hypothetical protein